MLLQQRAQISLSTGAGGLGMSSAEASFFPASVGTSAATLFAPRNTSWLTSLSGWQSEGQNTEERTMFS